MNLPRFTQSVQAVRFLPCTGGGGCVAVPPVEISSAIYKGRFRNCSAGLYICLHEKKERKWKKKKKSVKKTGGKKRLADYGVTRGKRDEITQRKFFSCEVRTS